MKFRLALSFTFGFLLLAKGGTTDSGSPADVKEPVVSWTASTNSWPESLWVYEVVPQQFPAPVISNLLALGSFTAKDRTKKAPYPDDAHSAYYGGPTKHLMICPSLGFIEYRNDAAEARSTSSVKGVPEPVRGVPNESEATRLGLKYLRLLGINRDELATKPNSTDLDLHWDKGTRGYNNTNGVWVDEILNYGVLFLRRIDGIKVRGFGRGGGVTVSFGNDGRVIDLRVCWRNLRPYALRECPSPEQIAKWIKNGHIVLHLHGSQRAYPVSEVRTLTIASATPRYDGNYYDEPMDLVYPYAEYTGIAENEHATNAIWFESPMTLSKDNWRVLSVK